MDYFSLIFAFMIISAIVYVVGGIVLFIVIRFDKNYQSTHRVEIIEDILMISLVAFIASSIVFLPCIP